MPIISAKNLDKWQPNTDIIATQVKEEFQNIYNLLNGNLDAANLKNGGVTGTKLADDTIDGSKVNNIPATKVTGRFTSTALPENLLTTSGGTINGSVVYDTPAGTPLIKNYKTEETVLYEGGTGDNKIKLIVGGDYLLKLTLKDVVMWSITAAGVEIPKQFIIPTE